MVKPMRILVYLRVCTREMSKFQLQYFKVFLCFRRIFRLTAIETPEDIKQVFEQYSDNGIMNIDQLHRFITEFQGNHNSTRDDAQNIFDSVKHLNIFPRKVLHLEDFFHYLLGDSNLILSLFSEVHQDMTAPLAHYFLYTGHNSYLEGNQFSSDSSTEPIIKALWNGVRVIELDLWPNGTKDDVDVCHGRTLTSRVRLVECLRAIRKHAFEASEYPVVITFEDHLTSVLQSKVARMVTEIFGGMLFHPHSELTLLPSPESLKKKIIISTKPPKEYLDSLEPEEMGQYQRRDEAEVNEVLQDEDEQNDAPEYRSLIAIHAVKLKGSIENWLSFDPDRVRRLSLSEQGLENACRTHGTSIVRFTQRNLLRVYPKGTRFDSSNYDPFVGWSHGAQMVAFNMQGHGKHLWVMRGIFRANGGCGYVKKPDLLLNVGPNGEVFDPSKPVPVRTTMIVKVYMGEGWHADFHRTHFDFWSPPDFYTRVGIAGVPADTVMSRTRTIEDQWVPVWNEEFEFKLTVPQLAVLRIEVLDEDNAKKNDFGGQTCLPVSELRSGIWSVPLYDQKGEKYSSVKLLLRFQFV